MVICLKLGADLHMAQLTPLPLTVSCFSKIQIGFTFLVPAHPGSPGKRAVKWVCVCVCVCSLELARAVDVRRHRRPFPAVSAALHWSTRSRLPAAPHEPSWSVTAGHSCGRQSYQPTTQCQRIWNPNVSNSHIAKYKNHIGQPFNSPFSGTIWVGWYQKKHSPTHTITICDYCCWKYVIICRLSFILHY